MDKIKLLSTGDGSHTLLDTTFNEHYHSTYGAIAESMHIFIDAGLKPAFKKSDKITVFEVGLGTGLNALLTLLLFETGEKKCEYWSVESNPLSIDVCKQLNYPEQIVCDPALFSAIYLCKWDHPFHIHTNFLLNKIHKTLQHVILPDAYFDVVYFDAFSPLIQPEMWNKEIFSTIHRAMKKDGVLTTYSTKGDVKRTLKEVGFRIEKLPGPKGKREILKATKL